MKSPKILFIGISLMKRVTFVTCVIFFQGMGYGLWIQDARSIQDWLDRVGYLCGRRRPAGNVVDE